MLVYVLFYLGQLSHFPSCFGAGVTNLNEPPSSFFIPSPLLQVRSWLHPCQGHCEQQAMRDEGVIYVAGHPLLNRKCTRLPGCMRLRNVSSGALNSTHSSACTTVWLLLFRELLVNVNVIRKRRCRSCHIGEWPGRPSGLAGEFPALPSGRSSRVTS